MLYWSCIDMNGVKCRAEQTLASWRSATPHRRGAQIAGFARLDHVVQGLHGLCDRDVGIEAVDLEKIDVVGIESS
jgi:hypothetical protein